MNTFLRRNNNNQENCYGEYTACPNCECGAVTRKFTVKKDGPNHGKEFYSCKECGSFMWASMWDGKSALPERKGGSQHKVSNSQLVSCIERLDELKSEISKLDYLKESMRRVEELNCKMDKLLELIDNNT